MHIRLAPPRASMPAPFLIAQWWQKTKELFVLDLGEPSCFACNWFGPSAPVAPDVSYRVAWEKAHLERAHLVPHALGGSVAPSNLVILCAYCHEHAPDWWDREAMLSWIRNQPPFYIRLERELRDAWAAIRPGEAFPDVDPDAVMVAVRAGGGTHNSHISVATIAAAIAAMHDGCLL